MCEKDILFCIFYYLGYIAIAGALVAGFFIFLDWKKRKEQEEK
ncbi:hypothetical protein SAMN06265182_0668 [Persephonella hydrogeniphila]|uniref:Uncharacterized protein n=1 Tax=Persephonella hydrogeniphila TaxID=198703 RepID=A0A285NA98_9AQUI|nr:hypothetical protein [Persephonella hydrogeniphila]SNZ06414.1 hypothetical protein SAMN06265182_0668 [Persephonella hydrogeniphila]